jgi:hypothetical protein
LFLFNFFSQLIFQKTFGWISLNLSHIFIGTISNKMSLEQYMEPVDLDQVEPKQKKTKTDQAENHDHDTDPSSSSSSESILPGVIRNHVVGFLGKKKIASVRLDEDDEIWVALHHRGTYYELEDANGRIYVRELNDAINLAHFKVTGPHTVSFIDPKSSEVLYDIQGISEWEEYFGKVYCE